VNLHEYQTKSRFGQYGIPVAAGSVAYTPEEVYDIAHKLGVPVVVKSQVLVGGRGKAGGIKIAQTPDQARDVAASILNRLEIKGHMVRKVLINPAVDIGSEIYLGVVNDRASGKPVMMASSEGGVEIEQVAAETPEKIIREYVSPSLGLRDYQARNLASGINLPREHWNAFTRIAQNLYKCFTESDATLAEINPLVITGDNTLLALDGKMSIDDNALFRQKELAAMRDIDAEPPVEVQAREAGLTYVKLDGQIGCMVNGAGLAMTTMDMIKLYGGGDIGPANFLDIGGGAQADKVATALRMILSDPNVKAVLFNIFGGITRGDEVARGILQALDEVKTSLPMVIRLAGTNSEEGRALIDAAQIPNIISAASLTEGAKKAIAAAKGEL
jgi:succinyl-CoA synthetase beta subunit